MTEPLRAIEGERIELREPRPQLSIVNPVEWDGAPVPVREWIVENIIPARTVSLLAGDGAVGKSVLSLQLAVARATGKPWLATIPRPGRTLILSAEDDAEEMHRRLEAIRLHYGCRFADLDDIQLVDLVGENAVLGELTRTGTIKSTPLFEALSRLIRSYKPDLVIVDALADAFAGDENNRSQARQFVSLLKQAAREFGCAFLCLTHPSLTGMSTGSGMSGSTGWSNSVRSRIYFEKAKASDGTEPDANLRTLTTKKANYAADGSTMTVRYENGVYVVQTGMGSLDKLALGHRAEETFLTLLRFFHTQGQDVSPKPGPTYAPTSFAAHPDAGGIGKKHFADAMQRLLVKETIRIDTLGPPSKLRSRLIMGGSE